MRVRAVSGKRIRLCTPAMSSTDWPFSTVRWEDVPKLDNRPVAFVAAGSHGVWSTPGYHVYADVSDSEVMSTKPSLTMPAAGPAQAGGCGG